MSVDILVVTMEMVLASSGQRPGILSKIRYHAGQPPTAKNSPA